MNKKLFAVFLCVAVAGGGLLWKNRQTVTNPSWAQPTMGTMAHITLSGSISKKMLGTLRDAIDATLEDVNRTMSTWQADTEISQFNRFQGLENVEISPEFAEVAQAALEFSKATDGAFDPTVKPLIDYWGFGPEERTTPLEEIRQAVGWQKVHLGSATIRKDRPSLQLDFSAIAKGYGVDRVAGVIAQIRNNFLVEIGGEIVASGTNPKGLPWKVGIENPDPTAAFGESILQILELSGRAMATSGDYRNFQIRADSTRYSHIIDPKSGTPAESDIAAVSVLAKRCMDADAVATALFVMGSEKSFQWLETHPGFDAFFILHDPKTPGFASRATPGFPKE
ncbi:FAD:protein FMN transferase [Tichowtungia aerotolerans]|uniref:FAD:protein FMN transferase n=1 Tax=Tichowtungia aerotolerans TaxID=2697043 RepID=A0A6P1M866_9BACT|nr:FAD:protein FMN transferase [Tichowtungia aerotolerans]QHI70077.1 FAD:protein FMN transferase [Tichowtungia aerotolerans]